jgi:phospholipid transport system substrate-binding protein
VLPRRPAGHDEARARNWVCRAATGAGTRNRYLRLSSHAAVHRGAGLDHDVRLPTTNLIAAFRRLTLANYASNFDSFDGQRFTMDPNVIQRGGDRVVQTTLIPFGEKPVPLLYRMRQDGRSAGRSSTFSSKAM